MLTMPYLKQTNRLPDGRVSKSPARNFLPQTINRLFGAGHQKETQALDFERAKYSRPDLVKFFGKRVGDPVRIQNLGHIQSKRRHVRDPCRRPIFFAGSEPLFFTLSFRLYLASRRARSHDNLLVATHRLNFAKNCNIGADDQLLVITKKPARRARLDFIGGGPHPQATAATNLLASSTVMMVRFSRSSERANART